MENLYKLSINCKEQKLVTLLCIFGFLSFFFSPLMMHHFAYHNDYRIWEYSNQQWGSIYPEFYHLVAIGRPIGALLLNFHLMFAKGMQTLMYYQIFSSLSIIALAVFFCYFMLTYLQISYLSAGLLSILIFTLPSMTLNSFWITNFIPCIIPIFLVIYIHILILQDFKKNLFKITTLLIISLLIYPPSSFFYITITFLKIAFPPKNQEAISPKNIYLETSLLLAISLLVFVIIKMILKPSLIASHLLNYDWESFYLTLEKNFSQYSLEFHFNLKEKFLQILQLINLVLDGWFKTFKTIPYSLIAGSLVSYIGGLLAKQNIYFKKNNIYTTCIILLALFFISAFPILVSSYKYEINFRVSFASAAFLPILLIYFFEQTIQKKSLDKNQYFIFLTFSIIFLFSSQACSLNRLILSIERSSNEYQSVASYLKQHLTPKTKKIVMFQPLFTPPDSKLLTKDFALNGTDVCIPGFLRVALLELSKNPDDYQISFIRSIDMIHKEENQLVILPGQV